MECEETSPAAQRLREGERALLRARDLTQQLLTFAKGGTPIRRTGSLAEVAEETAGFALSGSNVTARFALPADTWPCDFDRHQVGQVIDNLVINALQAMPDGGTIELRAANVELGPDDHALLPAGPYVRLSIEDHGVGMPREILPRIFDPFYTTKPRGHGLGLATCYSIVHRHGGAIEVESEPGRGSVFHLWLPATPGAEPAASAVPPVSHAGRGTILVMDDEDVVREVTAAMLSELGYEVLQARDGAEAIGVLRTEAAAGRRVAGLIFDLTIPGGMSGREALAEVRRIDPGVPVFVCSGYAADPVLSSPADYGFTASIAKPFRMSELAGLLQAHLPGDES
jgi:CheY-like chemotaxis protein